MATHQLSITLPENTYRLMQQKVASGEYSSLSEVVVESISRLEEADPDFDHWLRTEMPHRLAEIDAHPERLLTVEQMHHAITEDMALLEDEA